MTILVDQVSDERRSRRFPIGLPSGDLGLVEVAVFSLREYSASLLSPSLGILPTARELFVRFSPQFPVLGSCTWGAFLPRR